jgi:thiamine-monophosphate kinase
MTEADLIRLFTKPFPRSDRQLNELFECDAELLRIGDETWALSIDDFSPEEDLFTSENPQRLGANLVTATLSDLLAAGAEPRFFMHALTLPPGTSDEFLLGLRDGIHAALKQADCHLCGGDLGSGPTWRYSGFAMGPATRPLTRKLPDTSSALWVTGSLGDANLAALLQSPTPAFELRLQEAAVIRKYATGCIDTSGGLMDALWNLHSLNPHLRIELHRERIPLAEGLTGGGLPPGIPPEAALAGGAGEYELLFATAANLDAAAEAELTSMGMKRIADLSRQDPGLFIRRDAHTIRKAETPPPCPRSGGTLENHIGAVIHYATNLFGDGLE